MKVLTSLILSAALATPAFATTNDDPLMQALTDLNQKVVHVDETTPARLKSWGWNVMTYAVYVAGSIAILNPGVEAQVLAAVTRPPSDPMRRAAIEAEMAARAMGDDMYHYYFSAAQRNMLAITAMVATVGGVMWVVGFVSKWRAGKQAEPPQYYQSAETMQQFFRLSLEKQYEVANRDEAFKHFIFELHDAYLLIENGHPTLEAHP